MQVGTGAKLDNFSKGIESFYLSGQKELNLDSKSEKWTYDLKQSGWNSFVNKSIPNKKDESWKYTNLSFLNKSAYDSIIPADLQIQGIEVLSIKDVIDQNHSDILVCLEKFNQEVVDSFTDLNSALCEDLKIIYVPKNTKLDQAILIKQLLKQSSSTGLVLPRVFIYLDKCTYTVYLSDLFKKPKGILCC